MSGEQSIRDLMDQGGDDAQPGDPLPPGCPVTALGHCEGTYWFSDPIGQVRAKRTLRSGDLTDLVLGRIEWLFEHFKLGNRVDKWNDTAAAAALIKACVSAGPFDGSKIRGPGIWWEADRTDAKGMPGAIVIHAGDVVQRGWWEGGRLTLGPLWSAGCRIGAWVYKYSVAEPRIAKKAASDQEIAGLVDFIASWNWPDGRDDAYLFLGAMGVGFLPALLRHRPIPLIEGDTGCGKSSLFDLVERSHGGAAFRKESPTAAWVRDKIAEQRAARLYILNEFEAKSGGNNRAEELTELLRFAYGGEGGWGRGGRDGAEGDAPDLAGMVGAIMAPPAQPQDHNRRVVLKLLPLEVDEQALVTFEDRHARAVALGPKVRRRLLEAWPRFVEVYRLYQAALVKDRHEPRTITTWATTLALADVLAFGKSDPARIAHWADKLAKMRLAAVGPSRAPQEVLNRLVHYRIEEYRGSTKHTVQEYLLEAVGMERPDDTMAVCKRIGITLTDVRVPDPGNPHYAEAAAMGGEVPRTTQRFLAISTTATGVEEIFRNTVFAAGLWKGQLLQLEGARTPEHPIRFGSHAEDGGRAKEIRTRSAILVPLKHLGILDVDATGREVVVDGLAAKAAQQPGQSGGDWKPGSDFELNDD